MLTHLLLNCRYAPIRVARRVRYCIGGLLNHSLGLHRVGGRLEVSIIIVLVALLLSLCLQLLTFLLS